MSPLRCAITFLLACVLLAFAPASVRAEECAQHAPDSSVCTMFNNDYRSSLVATTDVTSRDANVIALLAMTRGSRQCKRLYQTFLCASEFPKCVPGATAAAGKVQKTCQKDCLALAAQCRGIDTLSGPDACAAFPTKPVQGSTLCEF